MAGGEAEEEEEAKRKKEESGVSMIYTNKSDGWLAMTRRVGGIDYKHHTEML